MSDILGTIFGKTSKEKSSSTSSSNSVSGNNAYDTINGALAPTLGYSNAGGSMIASLLGIPGYSPTAAPTVSNPATGALPPSYGSGVPQVQPNLSYGGAGNHPGNLRDLGRTDLGVPSSAMDNPYRYRNIPAVGGNEASSGPDSIYGPARTPMPSPTGGPVSGINGLNSFADASGIDFLRDQGVKAIEGSQAGRGMLQSGATGQALAQFGNNLGKTYLNDYIGHLLDLSKLGTANSAVLSDAGKYSNALTNSTSSGSGTGGKTGLLQTILGNSANSAGSIISAFA
jgi:hypothetical protein